ncbi:MAG TPA: DUF6152 family protein [Steroidobacteraceae bacterium]|nr:DUF6152 family protein [Steroidobacteraceae bacterium]
MRQQSLALAAVAVLAGASAFAHHSFAMFDQQKVDVMRGTLLKFTYLNPHSWLSVVGTVDNGAVSERWDIEATSPSQLAQIGIHADTIKPGDKVTVAFHPLRDGRHGGSLVFVVTPDGVAHGAKPQALGFDLAKLKPQ